MKNLRAIRESRFLTKKQVAELAGMPTTTYSRYESLGKWGREIDHADLITALRIARALGCAPEEMVEHPEDLLF